jgi:hypothetical protein
LPSIALTGDYIIRDDVLNAGGVWEDQEKEVRSEAGVTLFETP